MRVLCIEDGIIPNYTGGRSLNSVEPVKEGEIYEVAGTVISDYGDHLSYALKGFTITKRIERFVPISEIDETTFERNFKKELV